MDGSFGRMPETTSSVVHGVSLLHCRRAGQNNYFWSYSQTSKEILENRQEQSNCFFQKKRLCMYTLHESIMHLEQAKRSI